MFKVNFLPFYHGKSPLNHQLVEYCLLFSTHLKQIQAKVWCSCWDSMFIHSAPYYQLQIIYLKWFHILFVIFTPKLVFFGGEMIFLCDGFFLNGWLKTTNDLFDLDGWILFFGVFLCS